MSGTSGRSVRCRPRRRLIAGVCLGVIAAALAGTGAGETAMAVLTVDLQEGFRNDHVVVRVEGREVYAKRGVSTNWSIGRADGVEVDVPAGTVAVEVRVPSRGLSDRLDLEVPDRRYLGVSLANGGLRFEVADQPFTYF